MFTGYGWSFLVLFFAVMIGGLVFFKDFRQDSSLYRSPWPEIICATATVIASWFLGRWLNRGRPSKIFEGYPPTGHSFWGIRVEYCGLFAVFFYGYLIFKGNVFP
ncbi:MAG: hypothetical protein HYS12_29350 [Planctomycetes bacterium]|nr:hypothetical protein [Planctomycetota bacterium]